MKTKCPHCGHKQEPNAEIGDIDICDNCGNKYTQFTNTLRDYDRDRY